MSSPGCFLRPVHQFGPGFPGAVGGHQHAEAHTRHLQDGAEIGHRVPGHLVHQGMAVHRDGHLANRVAVGLGHLERRGDLRARGTGLVDHHDGLAEQLLGLICQDAQGEIGLPAGWPGHDEGDGAAGPGFGSLFWA